jgi:hypothetical protein
MPSSNPPNDDYLSLSALRARGWSPKLIERELGEPNKTARNPMYRTAAPCRLWLRCHVEAAEKAEPFLAHQARRQGMSRRSKSIAEGKREALLARIAAMAVDVRALPIARVRAQAIMDWEDRQAERGRHDAVGAHADAQTRDRWTVNFIRHQLCEYDLELDRVAGQIGVHDAVAAIRSKVYAAIAAAYPVLADECRRQCAERAEIEPGRPA